MFAGWDWGNAAHDVTVMDADGTLVERFAVPHVEQGIATALERLAAHGDPGCLPVAIETTRGLVVDRLLAAGHPVVPVHPNAFHAARPRWGAARAKTDPGDSFKLADYLRTDCHRLPALAPVSGQTLELQALVRLRKSHLEQRVSAVNQLAALLDAHWPGAKGVFSDLASDIALAFLQRYPNPESAARLTPAKIEAFCRKHGYSGRRTGAELHARLRSAPTGASRLAPAAVAQLVQIQISLVKAIRASLDTLETKIAAAVRDHRAAELFQALPQIGTLSLAQIISEVVPILERAKSFDQLAAETGLAPVTRASGKTHVVSFRHTTNKHARQALTVWIDNSRRSCPWAGQRYSEARARGQRHPHAIRTLGRAWLRVIWACWREQTPYNPSHQKTLKPAQAA